MKKIISVIILVLMIKFVEAKEARDIYYNASSSVVTVRIYNDNNKIISTGSGFYVRPRLIATNFHVIKNILKNNQRGDIKFVDNNNSYNLEVVIYDKKSDLALLRVDKRAQTLDFADCSKQYIGDTIYSIGSPKYIESTFAQGNISNIIHYKDGMTAIQFTAPISSGNSGGPLLNSDGEVVGVSTAAIKSGKNDIVQNINFAIAIKHLKELINRYETEEPLSQYKRLDKSGNLSASYALGMEAILSGNCKNAISYLSKSAKGGYVKAQSKLATMIYSGKCYKQDINKAQQIFQQISKQADKCSLDFLQSNYMVANIEFYDKSSINKALSLYESIASYQHKCRYSHKELEIISYAAYMSGYIFEHKFNYINRAKNRYKLSAKLGYKKARIKLGLKKNETFN